MSSALFAHQPAAPAAQRDEAPNENASDAWGEDADVRAWITQLGSPFAAKRETATKELVAAGERVMPELWDALESDDREVRTRAEYVAKSLEAAVAKQLKARGLQVSVKRGTGAVHAVQIRKTAFDASDMRRLACLYRLATLIVDNANFEGRLPPQFSRLRPLIVLQIQSGEPTPSWLDDTFMSDISALTNLRAVVISSRRWNSITDHGIRRLDALAQLELLHAN